MSNLYKTHNVDILLQTRLILHNIFVFFISIHVTACSFLSKRPTLCDNRVLVTTSVTTHVSCQLEKINAEVSVLFTFLQSWIIVSFVKLVNHVSMMVTLDTNEQKQ